MSTFTRRQALSAGLCFLGTTALAHTAGAISPIARNGMGLGLYISREIVRGLGGDLRAESTVGIGTTFTVRLPRTEVDPH